VRVLGISGWSGSGKTTLIEKLIPELRRHGITVSTLKHAHHDFDIDKPGKDSWRHRQAGASEVLVASDRRLALMRELPAGQPPSLEDLLDRLAPVDLVLVEGFKTAPIPRLEIWRSSAGNPRLEPGAGVTLAVVCDTPAPPGGAARVLDIDDIPAVARFVAAWLERKVLSTKH
jgi:molybdopterin-guanine dinucleotide biosynthesis protein B